MESRFSTIKELSEIPEIEYQGYIWKSDQSEPDILNNEAYDFSTIKTNPFIIEGYLYSAKENISISIKQIDGEYFINKIDLSDLDFSKENFTKHNYLSDPAISKQNKDYKYINFIEFWKAEEDDLCNDMKVLKPDWVAFVGFSKEEWK